MPKRTETFRLLPWGGGLNTSVDPGMISTEQLVNADNIIFETSGTRKKRSRPFCSFLSPGLETLNRPAARKPHKSDGSWSVCCAKGAITPCLSSSSVGEP